MEREKVCGTCEFHEDEERYNGAGRCMNDMSSYFNAKTRNDDGCDEYEPGKVREGSTYDK